MCLGTLVYSTTTTYYIETLLVEALFWGAFTGILVVNIALSFGFTHYEYRPSLLRALGLFKRIWKSKNKGVPILPWLHTKTKDKL